MVSCMRRVCVLISSFNNEHERAVWRQHRLHNQSAPLTHLHVRNFPYSFHCFGSFNLSNGKMNVCARLTLFGGKNTDQTNELYVKMHFTCGGTIAGLFFFCRCAKIISSWIYVVVSFLIVHT